MLLACFRTNGKATVLTKRVDIFHTHTNFGAGWLAGWLAKIKCLLTIDKFPLEPIAFSSRCDHSLDLASMVCWNDKTSGDIGARWLTILYWQMSPRVIKDERAPPQRRHFTKGNRLEYYSKSSNKQEELSN